MTEILSEIDDDKEEKEVEVHYGKVQFLRLEHGYIRAKSKINGITKTKPTIIFTNFHVINRIIYDILIF